MDGPVVAIPAIEHCDCCPRQCALIHCDGVWRDNSHTRCEASAPTGASTAGATGANGGRLVLRLSGRADAVEIEARGVRPVEYKSGIPHGKAAHLQLCAQARCLEEMLDVVRRRLQHQTACRRGYAPGLRCASGTAVEGERMPPLSRDGPGLR